MKKNLYIMTLAAAISLVGCKDDQVENVDVHRAMQIDVSVCDAFHDRISGIGQVSMRVDEALHDIEKYRDIYYDGKVVDIFESFIAMYPVGTYVLTNRNEEAVVVEQTEYFTDRPLIKLLKNGKGEPYNREKYVNLSETNTVRIVKSI